MNICKTEQEYLDQIIEPVRRCCKRYGYLPSVLIAQSCLENGYGIPSYWDNPQISALMTYNNMVGIKTELLNKSWTEIGLTVWPGDSLDKQTPEEYNGQMVTITDSFRKYDSIEQSFADYLCFMTWGSNYGAGGEPKYGQKVLAIKDPETLINKVKELGYATGSTYPKSVMRIVNKHDLTQYDDLTGVEPTSFYPEKATVSDEKEESSMTVTKPYIEDRISVNASQVPAHNANSHKYLAIHYLGVTGENPDLYGGGYGGHFYVSKKGVCYQAAKVTDKLWHVGASSGFSYIHSEARNTNTIGIECGTYLSNGKWFFTEKTQEACAQLAAWIMTEYNIPMTNLLRHGDITTKCCPAPYMPASRGGSEGISPNWTWAQFKSRVQELINGETVITLLKGSTGDDVLKLQNDLDALGYYEVKKNSAGKWYEEHLEKDGSFGDKTAEQVVKFQKYEGLETDGVAGPITLKKIAERIAEMNGKNTGEEYTMEDISKTIGKIVSEAKEKGWSYGNSRVYPPCLDSTISCDRLISLALYRHGIKCQPNGGWAGSGLESALLGLGWVKADNPESVTGNAVVVIYKNGVFCHAYWQTSYDPATGLCSKYDMGDEWRWKESDQPFVDVKRNEWTDGRVVGAVYVMPEGKSEVDATEDLIREGQKKSIEFTGHEIKVDGDYGSESKEQAVRCIQHAANLDYKAGLKEDGDRGPKTDAFMNGHYIEYGESQYLVTAVEIIAMMLGKDPKGVEMPGHFGDGLAECLGTKKLTYAQIVKLIG